jgi:hypothetical protein
VFPCCVGQQESYVCALLLLPMLTAHPTPTVMPITPPPADKADLQHYSVDAATQEWWDGLRYGGEGAVRSMAEPPDSAPPSSTPVGWAGSGEEGKWPLLLTTSLSKEWKSARRSTEWRARWLEMRLQVLHHQRRRYQEQLQAALQQERQQEVGSSVADGTAAAAAGTARWEPKERVFVPELALPALLDHPFFAAHSAQGGRRKPDTPRSPPRVDRLLEDDNFPARAHAALDLLDQQLATMRAQLLELQRSGSGAQAAAMQRPMGPVRTGRWVGGWGCPLRVLRVDDTSCRCSACLVHI